jgi:hypothetical protein
MEIKMKHYDLIVKWAEGAKIEVYNRLIDDYTIVAHPIWEEDAEYRVYDPYRDLKKAAEDPTKEVGLIKDYKGVKYEHPRWEPGIFWNWTSPPDYYEIRDKHNAKKQLYAYFDQSKGTFIYRSDLMELKSNQFIRVPAKDLAIDNV